MRLWSMHPKYLDAKGLVALWREGLLAQKVLQGETQGYRNHPQLNRFKTTRSPLATIDTYLYHVYQESLRRGYHFDRKKISRSRTKTRVEVTSGQISFERKHLLSKLKTRDPLLYREIRIIDKLDAHPLFHTVAGGIADWEIMKSKSSRP